jgi:hypothetical protein
VQQLVEEESIVEASWLVEELSEWVAIEVFQTRYHWKEYHLVYSF